jgi:DNA-directed RNA polymerase subunit beta
LNFLQTFSISDFLDVQVKSLKIFSISKSDERGDEGLYKYLHGKFSITDTRNNFVLEFLDFGGPTTLYNSEMYRKGLTYSVPLKARLKLYCTDQSMKILKLLFKMFILVPTYTMVLFVVV